MKNIINLTLATVMMVLFSTTVFAQDNVSRQRMSREQLAESQAKFIAKELALDNTTSEKLVNTYCDFQKEVWALGTRVKPNKKGNITDEEAQTNIKNRFEHSQKILSLREKYYKKYSTFLSQKQIQRVYEIEREMMKRLSKHNQSKQRKRGGT